MATTAVKFQTIMPRNLSVELNHEEVTAEEEAAIEKGRKAYAKGDWKTLNQLKYELASSRNRTSQKKS